MRYTFDRADGLSAVGPTRLAGGRNVYTDSAEWRDPHMIFDGGPLPVAVVADGPTAERITKLLNGE